MYNDNFIRVIVMKIVNFVQNSPKFRRFWEDPLVSFASGMKIETKFLMLNSLQFEIIGIIITVSVGKIDDQADFFSWNGLRMHASTYAKLLKLKIQASRLFDEIFNPSPYLS